jgi:nitric oxide synthase-interacting protein
MTKHSKNNTASSIFSYAEYKKLDYGTKRQRLGNESMRQFDACSLCLQRAREPLSCTSGHLFCKECVYTDLCPYHSTSCSALILTPFQVAQKKDIRRQKERFEALHQEEEEEKERVKEAARQRVLQNFERGQSGLGIGHNLDKPTRDGGGDANERVLSMSFLCR